MRVRNYGSSGPLVFVLHGGPAAVGSAAPIAKELSDSFRVVEPWQRASGKEPLTVARHVEDLNSLIANQRHDSHPALVGHSWGAMLALCYAAVYPDSLGAIVLVGCGTFDPPSRDRMKEILASRTTDALRERLAQVALSDAAPGTQFIRRHKLTRNRMVYDHAEPWPAKEEFVPFDARAHDESWQDMMRLQADGTYPRAFSAVKSPVLMLHGDYDPHPGTMIRDNLEPLIPQLEYQELKQCGHSPWRERHARNKFFSTMKDWLTLKMGM